MSNLNIGDVVQFNTDALKSYGIGVKGSTYSIFHGLKRQNIINRITYDSDKILTTLEVDKQIVDLSNTAFIITNTKGLLETSELEIVPVNLVHEKFTFTIDVKEPNSFLKPYEPLEIELEI